MSIEVSGIVKRFGSFLAVDRVDLGIREGELLALLGPSGSGKTTLLRIIAGLEFPDEGRVRLNGEDVTDTPARARRTGFVFQHYALFRHMTVFDNIAFGPRVLPRRERPDAAAIRARVERLLALMQIEGLGRRYPSQLSGGQRQRVALARALAIEPKVLLLDEPFGALDAQVRKELRRWLRQLHDEIPVTSVFVTHDQEEALEVADRVVVMRSGRIEQIGTPDEVYDRPANAFVWQFLGNVNRIPVRWQGGRPQGRGIALDALAAAGQGAHAANGDAVAYVRPHDIALTPDPAGAGVVRFIALPGATVRLGVALDGEAAGPGLVEVELPRQRFQALGVQVGSRVTLSAGGGDILAAG